MKPFNREKFLLFMLAGLLTWQAAIFSLGVVICSRVSPKTDMTLICPEIGSRFDKFVQTTLGAVLGLLAGAAAISSSKKSDEDAVTRVTAADRVTRVTQDDPIKTPRDSGRKTTF